MATTVYPIGTIVQSPLGIGEVVEHRTHDAGTCWECMTHMVQTTMADWPISFSASDLEALDMQAAEEAETHLVDLWDVAPCIAGELQAAYESAPSVKHINTVIESINYWHTEFFAPDLAEAGR